MRTWKKPIVVEIAVGMEINCYVCAELQASGPDKPDQTDEFVGILDSSNLFEDNYLKSVSVLVPTRLFLCSE